MKNKFLLIALLLCAGSYLLFDSLGNRSNNLVNLNIEALTNDETPSIPCNYKEGSTCTVLVKYADGSLVHVEYQDMEKE